MTDLARLGIISAIHWFCTVGGWYLLGALEQGVADGTGVAPVPLIILHIIMQILTFPIVFIAVWLNPMQIGGFRLDSFFLFVVLAALNSALVVAVLGALLRALSRRNPGTS